MDGALKNGHPIGLVLLSLAILLASCNSGNQREGKPSPDWSRGVLLGRRASGTLGIAVDEDSERVSVVWPFTTVETSGVQYVQLDERGVRESEWTQPVDGGIRTTRLLPGNGSQLHLFFASRPAGEKSWDLMHILLDGEDGEAPDLSKSDRIAHRIGKYTAITDETGGAFIVGEHEDPGELWVLHLDADGIVTRETELSGLQGESPSITRTNDGKLHLAFLAGDDMGYAQLEPDTLALTRQSILSDLGAGLSGYRVDGPTIGIATEDIFVLWAVTPYTDTETGQAKTFYIAFDASEPRVQTPTRLWILSSEDQPYTSYEGPLPLNQWVVERTFSTAVDEFGQEVAIEPEEHPAFVDIVGAVSLFVMNPTVMSGTGAELAVAVVSKQEYHTDFQTQIAVAFFKDRVYRGYTLATRTERLSDHPALVMAENGDLHVAWREGSSGSEVFYATTAPKAREWLDRLTVDDAIQAIPRALTDMAVGLLLTPLIGIWWILPGTLGLGLWRLLRPDGSGENLVLRILFVLALLVYYLLKMLILPTLFHYVPFSAWIFVPASWEQPLRYGVPPLIFLLALGVAALVHQRRSLSPPGVYLLVGLTDAAITLMVYGISFLGVF